MAKVRTRDGQAELRTAVWILHGSIDPLETLAACSAAGGMDRFAVRISGGAHRLPIEAHFIFSPSGPCDDALLFRWTHVDAAPLPSMTGTITARRFGPLVMLSISARYACGLDVPERLFFEAIGCRLARRTFAALRRALIHLLQHLPARSMHEV